MQVHFPLTLCVKINSEQFFKAFQICSSFLLMLTDFNFENTYTPRFYTIKIKLTWSL